MKGYAKGEKPDEECFRVRWVDSELRGKVNVRKDNDRGRENLPRAILDQFQNISVAFLNHCTVRI